MACRQHEDSKQAGRHHEDGEDAGIMTYENGKQAAAGIKRMANGQAARQAGTMKMARKQAL